MRISRLERYIFREFAGAFVLALTSITSILFIGSAFRLLSSVPGLDLLFILEVTPLILPYVTVHAMPLAGLVGAVTCYCRLAGDREIMAMKLTGAAFTRFITPTLFLGMLLAFVSVATNNFVSPYCRNQLNAVKRNAVTKIITKLSESRTSFESYGFKFHWRAVKDGRLEDVLVYRAPRQKFNRATGQFEEKTGEAPQMLHAKRGTFRLDPHSNAIKFELEGIIADYDGTPEGNPWLTSSGPKAKRVGSRAGTTATPLPSLPTKGDFSHPFESGDDLKFSLSAEHSALMVDLDSVGGVVDRKAKAKDRDVLDLMALRARDLLHIRVSKLTIDIEIHRRLSNAFSNLTLALLGAAIGLLFRGPNRILAYLVAFGLGLAIYYPLTQAGEGLATNGVLPAFLAMQLGNIALLITSFLLFRRSVR